MYDMVKNILIDFRLGRFFETHFPGKALEAHLAN